jgi:hypothetical protein
MWNEDYRSVCRRHPDLVAVYDSRHGSLALLLRQNLVPVARERARWVTEVRHAAAEITRELRGAGFDGEVVVLQWQPLRQVGRIFETWTCSYNGDTDRHAELLDAAKCWSADEDGLAARQLACLAQLETPADGERAAIVTPSLVVWYRDMMPSWLGSEPPVRRLLVLRTHRWIMERAFARTVSVDHVLRDLAPVGTLSLALARLMPRGEFARWAPWIRLVRRDLVRALGWSAERRGEAWARWLFLIPYAIPVPPYRAAGRPRVIDGSRHWRRALSRQDQSHTA